MTQDDIPGVRGAPRGSGGAKGLLGGVWVGLGGSSLLPVPKNMLKQQSNDPKPWVKVPKVCPDPN